MTATTTTYAHDVEMVRDNAAVWLRCPCGGWRWGPADKGGDSGASWAAHARAEAQA